MNMSYRNSNNINLDKNIYENNLNFESLQFSNDKIYDLFSNKEQSDTSTKEINETSRNKIVIETREEFINTLKNEKEELLNSLNEKKFALENISEENQELKISIVQKEKDLINKNNEYDKLKLEIFLPDLFIFLKRIIGFLNQKILLNGMRKY